MEDLVARITSTVGIDANTAQTAIGVILGFLSKEGPSDAVGQVLAAIPGAEELLAGANETGEGGGLGDLLGGGGLGGLAGAVGGLMGGQSGGLMAAASELMSAGLDMGQIQGVAQEVIGYAREQAGEETVNQIVAQIPGMDQFV